MDVTQTHTNRHEKVNVSHGRQDMEHHLLCALLSRV